MQTTFLSLYNFIMKVLIYKKLLWKCGTPERMQTNSNPEWRVQEKCTYEAQGNTSFLPQWEFDQRFNPVTGDQRCLDLDVVFSCTRRIIIINKDFSLQDLP